jgi:transcription termination factor NusB
MVRELYELYATDTYSLKQLEVRFWNEGYLNYNGNKIAHTTLSGIISNPKYKGYYVGNKVRVIDMFTKKQKFLPPEEWVMFKDESGAIVPAIVTEELWERANAVLHRRSEDVKGRQGICNHANLLTGKLYCIECGLPYYRRESKDRHGNVNSKWVCSGKINNGAESCPSFPIYEEEIKPILFEVFKDTEADAGALLEEYYEMYKSMEMDADLQKKICEQKKKIDLANKKKGKLLELTVEGAISNSDFKTMTKDCTREVEEAEEELDELERQLLSKEEFSRLMEEVRTTLRCAEQDAKSGLISKEFVDRYIDKIYVTPVGEGTAKLEIRIFTGKLTEKLLSRIPNPEGRMGVTFKKMIESYENQIKTK